MIQFLRGALAMACLVAGLLFLRFWTVSRDRLFLIFALAFWLFSLNWALLALDHPESEPASYVFVIRLLTFVLIIAGILDKNRQKPRNR